MADDLTAIATDLIAERTVTGDSRGAYAQAFALFNCGIASGTVLGPLWMSSTSDWGWQVATIALGILSLSASLPIAVFYTEDRNS